MVTIPQAVVGYCRPETNRRVLGVPPSYDTASGSRVLSTYEEIKHPAHVSAVTIPQAVVGYCRQQLLYRSYLYQSCYDTASGSRVLSTQICRCCNLDKLVTIPQAVVGYCRQ